MKRRAHKSRVERLPFVREPETVVGKGTIRKDFATSVEANVIHGSDSRESAAIEIPYFFTKLQLIS